MKPQARQFIVEFKNRRRITQTPDDRLSVTENSSWLTVLAAKQSTSSAQSYSDAVRAADLVFGYESGSAACHDE